MAVTQQFESPRVHGGRTTAVIAWCAAASIGLLFVRVSNSREFRAAVSGTLEPGLVDAATLAALVAPLGALLAWHLFPRRSWAWLLLAGAVCTVPLRVIEFAPAAYGEWMFGPLTVLVTCAPVFTLVGVLAAATTVWQAGRRAVGAALVGAALTAGLVGTVVILGIAGQRSLLNTPPVLSVVSLILALVAVAGAVVAMVVVAGAPLPAVRPRLRVTVASGVVIVASQAVARLWLTDEEVVFDRHALGDHFLQHGLVLVAIGLAGGAVAGARPLIASAAAGLILGAFATLVLPSTEALEMPVLTASVAVGGLLAGLAAGLSRWRARIGAVGLAATALGLVPLSYLSNSDLEYDSYEGFVIGATPVLLVIGTIAAVAALSSLGVEHAATAETPAVLGVLATGFMLGTNDIINYFTVNAPQDRAPIAGLLPPVVVVLLVAAGLVGALTVARRRTEPPTEPLPVSQN